MRTLLDSPRRLMCALAVLVALMSLGSQARAQGHTPDPYNIVGEYNSQYEPYLYASEPTQEGTLPNQNRLEGRLPGARESSRSLNGLDDLEGNTLEPAEPSSSRRRAGSGTPYYRAALDDDRTFRTNLDTDESYFANQRKRSDDYFKAMSIKDPKKRARLLRELSMENLRVSRLLPNFKSSAGTKRGERLTFDSPSDGLEDDKEPRRRPRNELLEDDSTTRKRPSTKSDESQLPRSRPGVNSRARRSSTTSPSRTNSSRTQAPAAGSSSAVDSILERSERFDSPRGSSTPKPASNASVRPRSSQP